MGALLLAYPTVGLSHCLVQDKQLELAHAVRYYTGLPSPRVSAGYNTPNADAPLRSLLDLNLRDSTVEDNVRKRPFFQNVLTPSPYGLTESGAKIRNYFESSKKKGKKVLSKKEVMR